MWWLLLAMSVLHGAQDCGPVNVLRGHVFLLCKGCRAVVIPNATLRLETATHVAEVITDRQGAYEIHNLPPGDYKPSIKDHKLAWSGAFGIIRVPAKGCAYGGLSFSAYGPAEQAEEALMTARNYLFGAIDLLKDLFR